MAQQAILAANRRRRTANNASANLSVASTKAQVDVSSTLRLGLKSKARDLYRLFSIWDENGDGTIDEAEV